MKPKIDPLTGEKFIPRRLNQVFKNPGNRIKYNNLKAKEFKNRIDIINKPLVVNLLILEELLNNKNEAEFHREFLSGKGFNFKVFTHFDIYNEKKYPCIYQFIVTESSSDKIIIRKNDRYLSNTNIST